MNAAQKKEQAELDWMAFSSKLTSAWCARFRALAAAKEKAAANSVDLTVRPEPKLPSDIALPEGANVLAVHRVSWPAEASADQDAQKPGTLEICYVRAEETRMPKKARAYYARQFHVTKPSDIHDRDNSTWLDARVVSQSDRRRSIDVVLSRADNQAFDLTRDAEEADLIVEILSIEIKDPYRDERASAK